VETNFELVTETSTPRALRHDFAFFDTSSKPPHNLTAEEAPSSSYYYIINITYSFNHYNNGRRRSVSLETTDNRFITRTGGGIFVSSETATSATKGRGMELQF
jgi:hypothetical protein